VAKLHFYYSAMNAGKTTTLLQSDYNYRERGMKTMLFTPAFDDRFEVGAIASRIGLKAHATCFDDAFDFYAHISPLLKQKDHGYKCILVDEAHFLNKKQVYDFTRIVDDFNIPVLAYGLRTDFLGEPFEGSQYLLAWAEDMIEIKTICHCGRKATMNARVDAAGRMVTEGAQVEIGGNDRYVATCRRHYYEGNVGHIDKPVEEL